MALPTDTTLALASLLAYGVAGSLTCAGALVGLGAVSTRPAEPFPTRAGPEPHAARKREILAKHPEIKALFGPEPNTKYKVFCTVVLQLLAAWCVSDASWAVFVVTAWAVGGTATQSLFLAIHELSHNLGAKSLVANRLIGFMANIPICIAFSQAFKPHHMAHHRSQGDEPDDDIATDLEAWLVSGTTTCYADHCLRKACFMFFQIFGYALRPLILHPDNLPPIKWLVCNWVVILTTDLLIFRAMGPNAVLYLLLSVFFAGSIHPLAGHFIAEHYIVDGKFETYSYYGPLNVLAYNVGYHNEHHDFPNVPGSRLPEVRRLAPEYYDDLPQCPSWPGMVLRFIFDDKIALYSRMKRVAKED